MDFINNVITSSALVSDIKQELTNSDTIKISRNRLQIAYNIFTNVYKIIVESGKVTIDHLITIPNSGYWKLFLPLPKTELINFQVFLASSWIPQTYLHNVAA